MTGGNLIRLKVLGNAGLNKVSALMVQSGPNSKWHQLGGDSQEWEHLADLMAIAEVAPFKLGSFRKKGKWRSDHYLLIPNTGRMGNGGVLEGGEHHGQLGVCHTTGCRYCPPLA